MKSNSENIRQSPRQGQLAKRHKVSPATVSQESVTFDPGQRADQNVHAFTVECVETPAPTPQQVLVELVVTTPPASPSEVVVIILDSPRVDRKRSKAD